MQRIENLELFQQFKAYETKVATENSLMCPNTTPESPAWLKRLAQKNDLSSSANTHYLLHGTRVDHVASIGREGLKCQYARPHGTYGQGIYFTDDSCKAGQYAGDTGPVIRHGHEGCILISRVVLGNVLKLDKTCVGRVASPAGYHSLMAAKAHTQRPDGLYTRQLHNEFIAFDDNACYPEFVLTVSLV